jgi:hypothetical protein
MHRSVFYLTRKFSETGLSPSVEPTQLGSTERDGRTEMDGSQIRRFRMQPEINVSRGQQRCALRDKKNQVGCLTKQEVKLYAMRILD